MNTTVTAKLERLRRVLEYQTHLPMTEPMTEAKPKTVKAAPPRKVRGPAAVVLNLKTRLKRDVTLVRGEEAEAVIVPVPKPGALDDYRKQATASWDGDTDNEGKAPDERERAVAESVQELFDAVNALKLSDFRISKNPEYIGTEMVVACNDEWISKWFVFRMRVDEWTYDGGEVNIRGEVFSTRLEPRY